jgi:hypothetical protein
VSRRWYCNLCYATHPHGTDCPKATPSVASDGTTQPSAGAATEPRKSWCVVCGTFTEGRLSADGTLWICATCDAQPKPAPDLASLRAAFLALKHPQHYCDQPRAYDAWNEAIDAAIGVLARRDGGTP